MRTALSRSVSRIALLTAVVARVAAADVSFISRADFPAGPSPRVAVAGRVNGDRLLDLVVGNAE